MVLLLGFFTSSLSAQEGSGTSQTAGPVTAVEKHGQLAIYQGMLVNNQQQAVSLAGPSLYWSNTGWGQEKYFNTETVQAFATEWNATIIRAPLGAERYGSVLSHPGENLLRIETVVRAAIAQGLYVIVDWHSHQAEQDVAQSRAFFAYMAEKYGDFPNIIYEIYNEPLNTTDWDTVIKPYSERIIDTIRGFDPDNIILVGTQSWSQDVDKAALNPIKNHTNIAYSLHFYAGTHKQELRDKAQKALDAGLALFVSEWGTVSADGNGTVDRESVEEWLQFMRDNKLSHCSWSVSNKDAGASIFKPKSKALSAWRDKDLTENGLYLKQIIRDWAES